jgi:CSLREA domain-containing protein
MNMAWFRFLSGFATLLFLPPFTVTGNIEGLQANPAPAANVIAVNTTQDDYDSVADADCSLREAITSSNLNIAYGGCTTGAGQDLILLPPGTYDLSISNTDGEENANVRGDLDIYSPAPPAPPAPPLESGAQLAYDLEILGTGSTASIIDAHQIDRVLDIQAGSSVQLNNLTIQNGLSEVSAGSGEAGGGIFNAGNLYLYRTWIYSNAAANGDPDNGGDGGGIYNSGILDLDLSRVTFNDSGDGAPGGNAGLGAGIYTSGVASIRNSTVEYNFGGSIAAGAPGGEAGHGGGIYNTYLLNVENSTIHYNYAGSVNTDGHQAGHGGGIYNAGSATVFNSTVAYNSGGATGDTSSIGGNGGGVYNSGSMSIYFSTFISNRMFNLSNSSIGAGIFNAPGASLVLGRSLVTENYNGATSRDEDCGGTITSDDYNLIHAVVGGICTVNGFTLHDLPPGTDAMVIYGISDRGGPTQTFGLHPDSPIVDYIPPGLCPATDQRGFSRPVDADGDGNALCEIGAVELRMRFYYPQIRK